MCAIEERMTAEPPRPASTVGASIAGVLVFVAFVAALMFGARALAPNESISSTSKDAPRAQGTGQPPPQGEAPLLPPLFVVKDATDPTPIALAGPRKKPMLLHLWASWCGPCVAELPSLLALGRRGAFDVVAVSVDDRWPDVVRFFEGRIPAEVVWDPKVTLEPTLGVRSLPTTFLVDTAGRVRTRLNGAQDWPALEQKLSAVLATP